MYYRQLHTLFNEGKSVISDYLFSEKQRDKLLDCAKTHDVEIFTIRLIGDLDILFERQKQRDLNTTRHLGHIVCRYHKGMNIEHKCADNLLMRDEFIKRCTTRGYGTFVLGHTIELDVSDFNKVDYTAVMDQIEQYILNE